MGRQSKAETEEKELSGILASLTPGGKYVLKVYRLVAGKQVWIRNHSPEELVNPEEFLLENYGEGKFLVRVWDDAASKPVGSKVVEVADYAGDPRDRGYMPPPAPQSLTMADAIALMGQQQERAAAAQSQMLQMMMGVMTAVIGASKPPDLAGIAALMKSFQGDGSGQLASVRELLALAKEIAPEGGREADPLTALIGLVPALVSHRPAVLSVDNPPAAAPPAAAPPAAALPAAALPDTDLPADNRPAVSADDDLRKKKEYLNGLIYRLMHGADAGLLADEIVSRAGLVIGPDTPAGVKDDAELAALVWEACSRYPWETVLAVFQKLRPLSDDEGAAVKRLFDALTEEPGEAE